MPPSSARAPAHEPVHQSAHEPASAHGPDRAPAHVMVVDDDDALRNMLHKALTHSGYRVESFGTGDLALEACRTECPDVLVSDLVMPGLNGQELAAAVRRECPGTILIFMSGYSEDELRDLDIRQVVFLPKPVSPRELKVTLERLLERREG